ncbi:hypothetical protein ABK905_20580 [Acerihabitans sp. KWT182]|uniref:Uncharacterized protein n=1 Tax=Acerihabitans sp. KWT182 TaxID=3157919 RepID=A0AAU7Q7D3_9GAMM
MDIDALLASQNPDDLRSLALKLLSENQAQEEAAATLRSALERQTEKKSGISALYPATGKGAENGSSLAFRP